VGAIVGLAPGWVGRNDDVGPVGAALGFEGSREAAGVAGAVLGVCQGEGVHD
jgi:hypothetical protein